MDRGFYQLCLEKEVFFTGSKNPLVRLLHFYIEVYLNPSRYAIYLIRRMQYLNSLGGGKFKRLRVKLLHRRLLTTFNMQVSPNCQIGIGLHLPHPIGIVIGDAVKLGNNCSIYQNVTVGGARVGDVKKQNQPTIGNNCTIFAGAMVLGKVALADNSIVAANSVLLKDGNETGVYAGTPAKRVK